MNTFMSHSSLYNDDWFLPFLNLQTTTNNELEKQIKQLNKLYLCNEQYHNLDENTESPRTTPEIDESRAQSEDETTHTYHNRHKMKTKFNEIRNNDSKSKHQHEAHTQRNSKNAKVRKTPQNHFENKFFTSTYVGYHPTEIHVTYNDGNIQIEGKALCDCGEGCIVKEFERTVSVPSNINPGSIIVHLDQKGDFSITGKEAPSKEHNTRMQRIIVEGEGFPKDNSETQSRKITCIREKGIIGKKVQSKVESSHYMWEDGYPNGVEEADIEDGHVEISTEV